MGRVLCLAIVVLILFSAQVDAQEHPIQLSLVTPIQLFSAEDAVKGVRLNFIYGRSAYVTGFDWGLINHATNGESVGVQFGVVGITEADFMGWQSNVVNIVENDFEGLQWGFVNYAHNASGLQLGLVNYAVNMNGLQIGLVNIIKQNGQFPVFPIVNWSF